LTLIKNQTDPPSPSLLTSMETSSSNCLCYNFSYCRTKKGNHYNNSTPKKWFINWSNN